MEHDRYTALLRRYAELALYAADGGDLSRLNDAEIRRMVCTLALCEKLQQLAERLR